MEAATPTDADSRAASAGTSELVATPMSLEFVVVGDTTKLRAPFGPVEWDADAVLQTGLISLLHHARAPMPRAALAEWVSATQSVGRAVAEEAIDSLLDAGLLEPSSTKREADEAQRQAWARYGWEHAFRFHLATNRLPKMNYADDPSGEQDKAIMRAYLDAEPQPPLYSARGGEATPLPNTERATPLSLAEAMRHETTFAGLGDNPIDVALLGRLLFLTVGRTGTRALPLSGRHVLKTSPSGGSRHPTESYLALLEGDGRGVYHYDVKDHALRPLADVAPEHVLAQSFLKTARLTFRPRLVWVLTSIPERSMFRYREARSYRVLHYDAGHVLQTISLAARAFGLRSQRSYALGDTDLERLLGIDGYSEAAIAATAIG